MKLKLLIIYFFALTICYSAYSQSVYYFSYGFTNISDTTEYHAFLVRFDDGTGFYRVRFYDTESKGEIVVDLDMEEENPLDKKGQPVLTQLYFKGSNPKVVYGDPALINGEKPLNYYPERFWFKVDAKTGLYEPWKVTSPDENSVAQGVFLNPPEFIEPTDLTKEFVSGFFSTDDAFYTNLFEESKTRGLTPTQKAATKIFLIAIANTEDDDIGESCKKDQVRNIKTFNTLSGYLGIQLITTSIDGKNFSKENVLKAVTALNPSPKDIVIVTYSGHGFTIPKENRKFPFLDLRSIPAQNYLDYTLNIEDIFMEVKKKGARLNLVLSDCCNNDPNSSNTVGSDIAQTRSSGLGWSMENCISLFLNEKPMSILMTSADIGEKASGNITFGGFFSYYFKVAMENHFSSFKKNVSWEQIMDDARKQTIEKAELTYCDKPYIPQNICKQHPFYKIIY